jgi:hypothetical protein
MSKRLLAEAIIDDIMKLSLLESLRNMKTFEEFKEKMIQTVQHRLEIEE